VVDHNCCRALNSGIQSRRSTPAGYALDGTLNNCHPDVWAFFNEHRTRGSKPVLRLVRFSNLPPQQSSSDGEKIIYHNTLLAVSSANSRGSMADRSSCSLRTTINHRKQLGQTKAEAEPFPSVPSPQSLGPQPPLSALPMLTLVAPQSCASRLMFNCSAMAVVSLVTN